MSNDIAIVSNIQNKTTDTGVLNNKNKNVELPHTHLVVVINS